MKPTRPVVYVCRDIERALGLELPAALREGYFIISNKTTFSQKLQMSLPEECRKNILLVSKISSAAASLLDTHELLSDPHTVKFIEEIKKNSDGKSAGIVVFKNTVQIERICVEHRWHLLNPSAMLAGTVEEKISQVEWLGDLARFLPMHEIIECADVLWQNAPFVLQFNHAHSGEGTTLIDGSAESLAILSGLQAKFPKRLVRKTVYISGPVFTCNAVVFGETILCGTISYQITGLTPFTDAPFATVGNDWSLAARLLSDGQKKSISEIAQAVGQKLGQAGWKGLFGIDVIVADEKNPEISAGAVFLLEINARQPASATFESFLQRKSGTQGATIFEAHLMALTDGSVSDKSDDLMKNISLIPLSNGAQLIQRVTSSFPADRSPQEIAETITELEQKQFHIISYENAKPNSDFLRIQTDSADGFLKGHNEINPLGQEIRSILLTRTLSSQALAVIANYLHLPPPLSGIACPYYNNRRAGMHAGLRPLIGKGSPCEICDEAVIIALRKKIPLAHMTPDNTRKFMVDNHLGIDCSGFAYHILDTESKTRGLDSLRGHLSRPYIKNPLLKLYSMLRPVENTSVRTFVHEKNSHEIKTADAQPGDFIVMLETGPKKTYNHIVVIHKVEYSEQNASAKKLHYTHSFAWPDDGLYGHGVRQGVIEITDSTRTLVNQLWIENGKSGHDNFTLEKAREAASVSLRRLNWF